MNNDEFESLASAVLTKHKDTSLRKRWEDAISFGGRVKVLAFWIRDSEDVVNIVWLSPDGIRDITWFPQSDLSTFSFLMLPSIVSVEVRESANVAKALGYDVSGELVVRVFSAIKEGTLGWVAETEEHKRDLRAFLSKVLTVYTTAVGA